MIQRARATGAAWVAALAIGAGMPAMSWLSAARGADSPAGASWPATVEPSAPDAEWNDLPEELEQVLEAKARAYSRRALRLTCLELVKRADYKDDEAANDSARAYEYLLVADRSVPGGYTALRSRPGSEGRDKKTADLDAPEPLLWTQLFDPAIRSTLRFKVGSWHTTPQKLAIPISWRASAPVFDGHRITEWSGTIEVEYRTGNPLSVTAWQNLQERRIVAELARFQTAFRFLGFSTAPPPIGEELTVQFEYEHEGFTYPSRAELHTFRQISRDTRHTVQRRRIEYGEYRFFGTLTEEEIPPLLYLPQQNAPQDDTRSSAER